jgi:hypothetical protein
MTMGQARNVADQARNEKRIKPAMLRIKSAMTMGQARNDNWMRPQLHAG